MTRFFLSIYDFVRRHRRLAAWLMPLVFIAVIAAASNIKLEEDISGFMPRDPDNERIEYLYRNIAAADKIIVRMAMRDGSRDDFALMDAADGFVSALDSLGAGEYISSIFYQVNPEDFTFVTDFVSDNLPLYLTIADYSLIDSLMAGDGVEHTIGAGKRMLASPVGMGVKGNLLRDPLHLGSRMLGELSKLSVGDRYELRNGYLFTGDGSSLMMLIQSANGVSETRCNAVLSDIMERAVSLVPQEVQVDYFGGCLVAVTNARRIKTDSLISIVIAVVLITGILLWFFRSFRTLIFIVVPVIFGMLLALAAMALFKGTLSAIALGAGSVIFGNAVNYSIYYFMQLRKEAGPRPVLRNIASPMLIGNITTVGAFLSLLFLSADSMRDFGLFAAFALVGTILFVLVVLPHISGRGGAKAVEEAPESGGGGKLGRMGSRFAIWAVAVLTVMFLFWSPRVIFEPDMQKINYMTPDQCRSFEELSAFTSLGENMMLLVAEGADMDRALGVYEKQRPLLDSLTRCGLVASVSGIGSLIPSTATIAERTRLWEDFCASKGGELAGRIKAAAVQTGFRADAFDGFTNSLSSADDVKAGYDFTPLKEKLLKDYLIEKPGRAMVLTIMYTSPGDGAAVRDALAGVDGGFVFDPVEVRENMLGILSSDLNYVLYICSFIVFAFLTLAFGRLEMSLVSLLPMAMTWIWILGIMSMAGIAFNIVNIILATFIFGMGDDYVIFTMDGLINRWGYGKKMLATYRKAIFISFLTMMIGIGSLIVARHPAMHSLAVVTIIGMSCVVTMAYIVPEAMFRMLTQCGGRPRQVPVTLKYFFLSLYALVAFLAGSAFLSISGFFLLTLRRKTPENKYRYHRRLCATCRWVVRNMFWVKFEQCGEKEPFEKPGIIICNHNSHIDLMYLLMLSPRIVVLTNRWVWNSPLYGAVIRYADFLPVADGIEDNVEKLRSLVEQGYSIAVFPEGTRSEDGSIGRFHKGAFYLAEKLGLDIIPVLFHGIGDVLPKRELIFRKGRVTTCILPRIAPQDDSFGEDYAARAKSVRREFVRRHGMLARRAATPDYYLWPLFHNYIYKGPEVALYARREMKKAGRYAEMISSLPEGANILVENSGMGFFALLCALSRRDLRITAVEPDADSTALAGHCAIAPANVEFLTAAPVDARFDRVISMPAV